MISHRHFSALRRKNVLSLVASPSLGSMHLGSRLPMPSLAFLFCSYSILGETGQTLPPLRSGVYVVMPTGFPVLGMGREVQGTPFNFFLLLLLTLWFLLSLHASPRGTAEATQFHSFALSHQSFSTLTSRDNH